MKIIAVKSLPPHQTSRPLGRRCFYYRQKAELFGFGYEACQLGKVKSRYRETENDVLESEDRTSRTQKMNPSAPRR
jgi:hypothetical protein